MAWPHRPRAAFGALLACFLLLGTPGAARAHQGGLGTEAMWNACDARKVDEHCAFESVDHDVYRGTCQAMSNALVCVRNQPIEFAPSSLHTHGPEPVPGTGRNAGRWWAWVAGSFVSLAAALAAFRVKSKAAV